MSRSPGACGTLVTAVTSETRDRLSSHWASEVPAFPVEDLPKPDDRFDRWSAALEKVMGSIVLSLTKANNGSLHDWRYDPREQRFEFQYQRLVMINVDTDLEPSVVTVSSRFFFNPKNQKPGQREGPLWDELWVVGEEVRMFDESVSKKFPTSASPVTGGKTVRRRTKG